MSCLGDADWAGYQENGHSTTGIVIQMLGSDVYWKSKRQSVVSLSSSEGEYVALSTTVREITWIPRLCGELLTLQRLPEDFFLPRNKVQVDSTAAMAIASVEELNARSNHMDVRLHHFRALMKYQVLFLEHITSGDQVSDILTKPLGLYLFQKLRGRVFDQQI